MIFFHSILSYTNSELLQNSNHFTGWRKKSDGNFDIVIYLHLQFAFLFSLPDVMDEVSFFLLLVCSAPLFTVESRTEWEPKVYGIVSKNSYMIVEWTLHKCSHTISEC